MKIHRWEDIKRKHRTPAELEKIERAAEAEVLEMNLAELRSLLGKSQVQLAELAKMSQGELSRAERREDHLLSTLRRIVKALGGDLEVRANFQNKSIRLLGV